MRKTKGARRRRRTKRRKWRAYGTRKTMAMMTGRFIFTLRRKRLSADMCGELNSKEGRLNEVVSVRERR